MDFLTDPNAHEAARAIAIPVIFLVLWVAAVIFLYDR